MMKTRIEDGVLIAEFPKGMRVDLETARLLVEERLKMQNGKTYPVLIHVNGAISTSKEVRSYMATSGTEGISRGAFVVKNIYEKVFVNFFMLVDAPKVPTRVFGNEQEAMMWLTSEPKEAE